MEGGGGGERKNGMKGRGKRKEDGEWQLTYGRTSMVVLEGQGKEYKKGNSFSFASHQTFATSICSEGCFLFL